MAVTHNTDDMLNIRALNQHTLNTGHSEIVTSLCGFLTLPMLLSQAEQWTLPSFHSNGELTYLARRRKESLIQLS